MKKIIRRIVESYLCTLPNWDVDEKTGSSYDIAKGELEKFIEWLFGEEE